MFNYRSFLHRSDFLNYFFFFNNTIDHIKIVNMYKNHLSSYDSISVVFKKIFNYVVLVSSKITYFLVLNVDLYSIMGTSGSYFSKTTAGFYHKFSGRSLVFRAVSPTVGLKPIRSFFLVNWYRFYKLCLYNSGKISSQLRISIFFNKTRFSRNRQVVVSIVQFGLFINVLFIYFCFSTYHQILPNLEYLNVLLLFSILAQVNFFYSFLKNIF